MPVADVPTGDAFCEQGITPREVAEGERLDLVLDRCVE